MPDFLGVATDPMRPAAPARGIPAERALRDGFGGPALYPVMAMNSPATFLAKVQPFRGP